MSETKMTDIEFEGVWGGLLVAIPCCGLFAAGAFNWAANKTGIEPSFLADAPSGFWYTASAVFSGVAVYTGVGIYKTLRPYWTKRQLR